MDILIISQYFPPEIGAAANRMKMTAEFFAKSGHKTTVLTSVPNYPDGILQRGYKNRIHIEKEENLTIVRVPVLLSQQKTTFKRLAHYGSFVVSAIRAGRKLPKPDLILVTSPPIFTGIIARYLAKKWKVPMVLDVRDIWPASVESVGAVRSKPVLWLGKHLAESLYSTAAHITATSDGIRKGIPKIFHHKVTVIPNGADFELFTPTPTREKTRTKYHLGEKFVALYSGNIGLAQAPEVLIEAAEHLKKSPHIVLLIVGSGVVLQKIKHAAASKKLTNIIFTGVLPRESMPNIVAASDVCIIPYKKAETFRHTLPSKIFDYMAGAKPIIINLAGEASELIKKAECGVTVAEEDGPALAEAIIQMSEQQDKAQRMGQHGRIFVHKNYRREVICQRLLQTLQAVLEETTAAAVEYQ